MTRGPGRSCHIAYRYEPEDLGGPAAFAAATLYVVGGLYGNPYALDTILTRAAAEPVRPEIVFNGDFHYLDADPATFRAVTEGVHEHRATLGNVEYALTQEEAEIGCGCDYPGYVPDSVVERSNAVVARLRATTAAGSRCQAQLARLPRYLTATIGDRRVGIVHGDPENLAGWALALEAIEPSDPDARARTGFTGPPTAAARIVDWCRRGNVSVLCCTHTGLPYAQDYADGDRRCLVANNGCAGLPNFADRHHGVLTRLSVDPEPPDDSLYGLDIGGARFDALPVAYDHRRWVADFERTWPAGSAGYLGYHTRITEGTWLSIDHAARGGVRRSCRALSRWAGSGWRRSTR
jgi:hypothetical protein